MTELREPMTIEEMQVELGLCREGCPDIRLAFRDHELWAAEHRQWMLSPEGLRANELVELIREAEESAKRMRDEAAAEHTYEQRLGDLARRTFEAWFSGDDAYRADRERIALGCERWAQRVVSGEWEGGAVRTLVLSSPATGVGKTHLSLSVLRRLAVAGMSWQRWNVVELLTMLRTSSHGRQESHDAAQVLRACQACDVLLLDDLGTQRGTDWELERLYEIVNARWERQLWTIGTANASEYVDLARGTDGDSHSLHVRRIASRLQDGGHVLVFGRDWPGWRASR